MLFIIRYLRNAILVPTWLYVGANMGPCWLEKNRLGTSCAILEASWAVLARRRGVWGGAAPVALQAD